MSERAVWLVNVIRDALTQAMCLCEWEGPLERRSLAAISDDCAIHGNAASALAALETLADLVEQAEVDTERKVTADTRARMDALAAEVRQLREALKAAVEGLALAADVHEAVVMDEGEDEEIQRRAVATMRLALHHARAALAAEAAR